MGKEGQPLPQSSNTAVDIWKSSHGVWSNSGNESQIIGSHDSNITMESSSQFAGTQYDHRISQPGRRKRHNPQRAQLSQGQYGHSHGSSIQNSALVGDRITRPPPTEGASGEKIYQPPV